MSSGVVNPPVSNTAELLYEGRTVTVPVKLFEAFYEYLGPDSKQSGSVTVHFKSGRVCEVEGKKFYK